MEKGRKEGNGIKLHCANKQILCCSRAFAVRLLICNTKKNADGHDLNV